MNDTGERPMANGPEPMGEDSEDREEFTIPIDWSAPSDPVVSTVDIPREEPRLSPKTRTGRVVQLIGRACASLGIGFPSAPIMRAKGAAAIRYQDAGVVLTAVAVAMSRKDTGALRALARAASRYLQAQDLGAVELRTGRFVPFEEIPHCEYGFVSCGFFTNSVRSEDRATSARNARAMIVRHLSDPILGQSFRQSTSNTASLVCSTLALATAVAADLPIKSAQGLAERTSRPALVSVAKRVLAEDFPDDEALAEALIRRSLVALGYPKRAASSLFEADGVKMKRAARSAGSDHSDT